MSERKQLFSWRQAVVQADCLTPTTRHVLLTIGTHMNDHGGGAYPSIETLSAETGLTCRAVSGALKSAEGAGFIRRTQHGYAGRKWRRNEYRACWPAQNDLHYGVIPRTKAASDTAKRGAQKKVTNAVAAGELEREPCVACGECEVEAHHADYSQPLEVFWLCREHHNLLHRAEKNGHAVAPPPGAEVTNEVRNDDSGGHEPDSGGLRTSFHGVTNEVRTNSPVNSPVNSPEGGSRAQGRAPAPARETGETENRKPKAAKKKASKGKRLVPEAFEPRPEDLEWAKARAPLIARDPERLTIETERFVNYHRAEGNRFADVYRAWRNWLLKAQDFARRDNAGPGGGGSKPRYLD